MPLVVEAVLAKSTKNYHVYEEVTKAVIVNPIYLKQEEIEVDGKPAKKIRISIEEIA
jgi:hypothetical protein